MKASDRPIGIFDSGIGGLTVAHAIKDKLPHERIIYFGDTAHLPYGDKSEAAIQAYSIKITDILLKKGCKVIVIACNSASSAAYELLKEYAGSRAKIINVIDPMVDLVCRKYPDSVIGLIGTKRTVASNVYASKIEQHNYNITLHSMATPLLVPMIEEGFYNNTISSEIIAKYLSDKSFSSISALILGCTHYPLIRSQINTYFQNKIQLLDSAEVVANYLVKHLTDSKLLGQHSDPEDEFLVSDYTSSFEASAKLFFKEKVRLTKYPLWN
ncbi:MAG: glutamate racemase [Candidatus Cyclobacteriaceae bacterium M2_1C_046]